MASTATETGSAATGRSGTSLSGRVNSSVSITPGYTTMTLMPSSHRSTAIASENAVSAAFEAS